MAGIGFELRKILSKDSYTSTMRAYLYAGLISSGPWVLSIISVMLIGVLSLGAVLPLSLIHICSDGAWSIKGLVGMRTLRLDPALGWPDLSRSVGVAGVRDLPQGRYVHLSGPEAVLALRETRDPRPALEEANICLLYTSRCV